jgi:hypothetical protein
MKESKVLSQASIEAHHINWLGSVPLARLD